MGIFDWLRRKQKQPASVAEDRRATPVDNAISRLSVASEEARVGAAMELLKSSDHEVRAAVASEVARLEIKAVGVWYELANALADDHESVRQASAKAFWQLDGVGYAIRSLRDEHENPAHMNRESALRGIHTLMEVAPEKSNFDDLLKENWQDCPILKRNDLSKSEKLPEQKDSDERPECVKCGRRFKWDEAYKCQDTPGAMPYTPQGYGDDLARVFCPHCGAIVVQWHITSERDYDEWAWFSENATINQGHPLPPSPILYWGLSIPSHLLPDYHQEQLDIQKVRQAQTSQQTQADEQTPEPQKGPAVVTSEVGKPVASFPYVNSLTVSPHNEDIAWISRWEADRFRMSVLSPTEESPRLELEYTTSRKPSGHTAIMSHVLFVAGGRLLVAFPLEVSSARLMVLDTESGKELASKDVPDFKFYSLCANKAGENIAAQKDSESLLVVSTADNKLTYSLVRTGSTYGPTPYFAPNGRLYALHYRTFFSIEDDKAVRITSTNEANSVAFDSAGKVYFGGGFSDRSGEATLQVVDLYSGESSEIPWGREPIDVIEPLGDDKLLLGSMVAEATAFQYSKSQVTLFRVNERKREWSIEFTDLPPYHSSVLLSVPEDGWTLLQSGRLLKRVSLDNGEVLEEFPKEKNEFVQAQWLGAQRMLYISRNRSKSTDGTLELYKIE